MAIRREIPSPTLRESLLGIIALLPSRNYLIQILRLLYESGGVDIDTFRQTYRGIVDEYMEKLLYRLGVYIDGKNVRLKYMSIGWMIARLLTDLFKLFDDEEFRRMLSEASGLDIPNPVEEWIYVRINTLLKDPAHGDNARIVLKHLAYKTTVTAQELTNDGLNIGEAMVIGEILRQLGLAEHLDGIIRLSPIIMEYREVFEKVLKRLGIIE